MDLEVRKSAAKGEGVYTLRRFEPYEVVLKFGGPVVRMADIPRQRGKS